jgi:hypothetical protein
LAFSKSDVCSILLACWNFIVRLKGHISLISFDELICLWMRVFMLVQKVSCDSK